MGTEFLGQNAIFPRGTAHCEGGLPQGELFVEFKPLSWHSSTNQFSGSRFRFLRNDADIIVISNKYIDEIRSLPTHVISPIQAHVDVWAASPRLNRLC